MSTASSRAAAAVLGAVVADAAVTPAHWQYNPAALAEAVGSSDPEFFPTSLSPFYAVDTGSQSGYGDLVLLGLAAARADGSFDTEAFAAGMERVFGEGSPYAAALGRRPAAYPYPAPVPGPVTRQPRPRA